MGTWKWLRNFLAVSVIEQIFWSYIPVWGPTLLVTVLGYLQARPWDILAMMTIGTFTLCVTGMFFFAQWRATKAAKGKFQFGVPITSKVVPNPTAVPRVANIKLGIMLRNTAAFQMEFQIEDVRSRIANRIDNRKKEIGKKLTIDSSGTMAHIDNGIDLVGVVAPNGNVEGDFYIKVRYGHLGDLRFEAQCAYAVFIAFDNDGDVQNVDATLIDCEAYLKGESSVAWQVPNRQTSEQGAI